MKLVLALVFAGVVLAVAVTMGERIVGWPQPSPRCYLFQGTGLYESYPPPTCYPVAP